jgi:protein gp37
MATDTTIEWTEKTWNPVCGCSIVSPGCHHCYAEALARRFRGMALARRARGEDPKHLRHYVDAIGADGRWSGRVALVEEALAAPGRWRRPAVVFGVLLKLVAFRGSPVWPVCHPSTMSTGYNGR